MSNSMTRGLSGIEFYFTKFWKFFKIRHLTSQAKTLKSKKKSVRAAEDGFWCPKQGLGNGW